MTLEEICEEVIKLDSLDDLKALNEVTWDRLKSIRTLKGAVVKVMCKVGDMVEFDSRKKGKTMVGMLMKKGRTRADVLVDGLTWKVPFSMIKKSEMDEVSSLKSLG